MTSELQRKTHRGPGIKQWRLIIRNLPFTTTKKDINQWIGTFGYVLEIVLPKCKDKRFPNSSAGFCFVQFSSRNEAEKAQKGLNFTELNGRKVAVDWALDKDNYVTKLQEEKAYAKSNEAEVKVELKTEDGEEGAEDEEGQAPEEKSGSAETEESENEEDKGDEREGEENDSGANGTFEQRIGSGKTDENGRHKKENQRRVLEDSAVAEGRVVFLRNVPFTADDEKLKKVAEEFGEVQLAILCRNKDTGDPAGTAFVHFRDKESADNFLDTLTKENGVLLEGRRIFGHRAVQRKEAKAFNVTDKKPIKDKRNLYLMRASLVRPGTAQAKGMSEEDAKLRQRLMEMAKAKLKNLVMFVSPTRLVIHNIPFSWTNAQLKSVCLDAAGGCPPSSVSECRIMCQRKGQDERGRVILGKSCGFGFVSFTEHTLALNCLRKLNNDPNTFTSERRPILEFSIENLKALRAKEQRHQNEAKSEETVQKKSHVESAEAVEKTKRELMAGGRKWLPRKFGQKIRHKSKRKKDGKAQHSAARGFRRKDNSQRPKNEKVKAQRKRKATGGTDRREQFAKRRRTKKSQ